VKLGNPLKKGAREGAFAGADFDDEVVGRGVDRFDEAGKDARIVQEVLPEPLTWSMRAQWRA
jgi:hypothetical protein